MQMARYFLFAALALPLAALAGTPATTGGTFPGGAVPASVVSGIHPGPTSPAEAKPHQFTYAFTPGAMITSEASRQFLNRIVTPFQDPVVKTTSPVKLEQMGSAIFVSLAPDQAEPVVLYVMARGKTLDSATLVLKPVDSGPVQIMLSSGSDSPGGADYQFNADAAKHWEQSSSFTDTITSLMRQLALGRVPPGYAFHYLRAGNAMPTCEQPGIRIVPKQVVEGFSIKAYIGALTNETSRPIEFNEQSCAHPGVEGVASWPGPLLQPGQSSEVYIAVQRDAGGFMGGSSRPSAIAAGAH